MAGQGETKTVLVLGGTGAMGKSLVDILEKKGFDVFVTSRKERQSRSNVTYIKGNAKSLDFLKGLLNKRYDAFVDFMSYSTSEFRERYRLFLNSTNQYVFISSARVYAESEKPITEESPRLLDVCEDEEYLKTDEYALSKARQEDLLLKSQNHNYTIIRPSLTYNDYRLQLVISEKEEWLCRALKGRSIVLPQDIMNVKNSMAWGGDVANALSKIVLNEKAYGQTIQIASEEALSWAEILDIYQNVLLQRLGRKAKIVYAPNALELARKLGRYYQIKYARAVNRTFDCGKLKSIIGSDFMFSSPTDGLTLCLNNFLNTPKFNTIPIYPYAYFDRLAYEHTNLSAFTGIKDKLKYLFGRYTGKNLSGIKRNIRKCFKSIT